MNDPNRAAEKAAARAEKKATREALLVKLPQFQEWPKIGRLNRDIIITEKIDGTNAAIGIVEEQVQVIPPTLDLGPDFEDKGTFVTQYKVYAQSRTRIITPDDDNFGFAKWVELHREALIDALGPGLHFGEWWGVGIGRGYDLSERRFSLFNTMRWSQPDQAARLEAARSKGVAIYVVPVLYSGPWTGVFGFKDGDTGEWLHAPQAWDTFDAEAAAIEKRIEEFVLLFGPFSGDGPALRQALRDFAPTNPRPRFAPNFIMEWLKRVGSQAVPGYMRPEGIVVFHRATGALLKATTEKDEAHKFEQTK